MRFLETQKVKDGHEVLIHFRKIQMFLSNYHFLQFCHNLPQLSQNDPTFGGFDDFGPFLA